MVASFRFEILKGVDRKSPGVSNEKSTVDAPADAYPTAFTVIPTETDPGWGIAGAIIWYQLHHRSD
jgi:hypothetical protein